MSYNLRNRHFLALRDFAPQEISFLLKEVYSPSALQSCCLSAVEPIQRDMISVAC